MQGDRQLRWKNLDKIWDLVESKDEFKKYIAWFGATDLAAMLAGWTERLALPRLSAWRTTTTDFPRIIADARGSSMKTNPIDLSDGEIAQILEERL